MRYTHQDMPRTFRVPFGPCLIPIVGSLLCILLMKDTSKEAGLGLLVWTAIGQIVYFSYGFWHSKRRRRALEQSLTTTSELPSIVEATAMEYIYNESVSQFTNKATESQSE